MTDDARTDLQASCGFTNIPGDQFCGSCGAFLEWDGRARRTLGAGRGSAAARRRRSRRDPARPAAWTAPSARPQPAPTAAWPTTRASDLVRCPACGIANPSTPDVLPVVRDDAGRGRAGRGRHRPTRSPRRSRWTPARGAGADPTPSQPGRERDSGSKRGIPSWVVGVGAIGVLVGVAIVLAGVALRGQNPGLRARRARVPRRRAPASSAGPGVERPSVARRAGHGRRARALGRQGVVGGRQPAKFAGRARRSTATRRPAGRRGASRRRASGSRSRSTRRGPTRSLIRNGYQASQALFRGNRRLKDILVSVDGGTADPGPAQGHDEGAADRPRRRAGGDVGPDHDRVDVRRGRRPRSRTPFDDARQRAAVLGVPAP